MCAARPCRVCCLVYAVLWSQHATQRKPASIWQDVPSMHCCISEPHPHQTWHVLQWLLSRSRSVLISM